MPGKGSHGTFHKITSQVPLPDGLCILGDACASFNPTYGQGMTVGIKGAVLMRDMLRKRLGGTKYGSGQGSAALQGFTKVVAGYHLHNFAGERWACGVACNTEDILCADA